MGLKKVVRMKPSNVILENGTVAYMPELNRMSVTIKEWIRNTNEYHVQHKSADLIIRIKAENVRV